MEHGEFFQSRDDDIKDDQFALIQEELIGLVSSQIFDERFALSCLDKLSNPQERACFWPVFMNGLADNPILNETPESSLGEFYWDIDHPCQFSFAFDDGNLLVALQYTQALLLPDYNLNRGHQVCFPLLVQATGSFSIPVRDLALSICTEIIQVDEYFIKYCLYYLVRPQPSYSSRSGKNPLALCSLNSDSSILGLILRLLRQNPLLLFQIFSDNLLCSRSCQWFSLSQSIRLFGLCIKSDATILQSLVTTKCWIQLFHLLNVLDPLAEETSHAVSLALVCSALIIRIQGGSVLVSQSKGLSDGVPSLDDHFHVLKNILYGFQESSNMSSVQSTQVPPFLRRSIDLLLRQLYFLFPKPLITLITQEISYSPSFSFMIEEYLVDLPYHPSLIIERPISSLAALQLDYNLNLASKYHESYENTNVPFEQVVDAWINQSPERVIEIHETLLSRANMPHLDPWQSVFLTLREPKSNEDLKASSVLLLNELLFEKFLRRQQFSQVMQSRLRHEEMRSINEQNIRQIFDQESQRMLNLIECSKKELEKTKESHKLWESQLLKRISESQIVNSDLSQQLEASQAKNRDLENTIAVLREQMSSVRIENVNLYSELVCSNRKVKDVEEMEKQLEREKLFHIEQKKNHERYVDQELKALRIESENVIQALESKLVNAELQMGRKCTCSSKKVSSNPDSGMSEELEAMKELLEQQKKYSDEKLEALSSKYFSIQSLNTEILSRLVVGGSLDSVSGLMLSSHHSSVHSSDQE